MSYKNVLALCGKITLLALRCKSENMRREEFQFYGKVRGKTALNFNDRAALPWKSLLNFSYPLVYSKSQNSGHFPSQNLWDLFFLLLLIIISQCNILTLAQIVLMILSIRLRACSYFPFFPYLLNLEIKDEIHHSE